ncbi:MAG: hypothetical protein KC503_39080 [Myxococcales bacterium]|nr:hypothetical protein [Myxococcales bacterium]
MYRDDRHAAEVHRQTLPLQRFRSIPDVLVHMYGYRQARIWGAIGGIAGFTAMLVDAAFGSHHLTQLLVISWALLGAGFTLGALLSGVILRGGARRHAEPMSDPFQAIAQYQRGGALRYAAARVSRLERASFTMPLVCLSLLAPLTLHLMVASLLGSSMRDFNGWILLSLVLVGHAHATLVILSVRHVAQIQHELDAGREAIGGQRGAAALVWTAAAAAVPGAVALFIPPVLVALTGATFVPWMFHWAARRAVLERRALDQALTPPEPLE